MLLYMVLEISSLSSWKIIQFSMFSHKVLLVFDPTHWRPKKKKKEKKKNPPPKAAKSKEIKSPENSD